mmetsp:Transcript_4464/g.8163  ORF Transcript_4464/g.8163 Transcript_4464/m.8163 type:complete len:122 (+) Transcript_4464:479-844(+)
MPTDGISFKSASGSREFGYDPSQVCESVGGDKEARSYSFSGVWDVSLIHHSHKKGNGDWDGNLCLCQAASKWWIVEKHIIPTYEKRNSLLIVWHHWASLETSLSPRVVVAVARWESDLQSH